MASSKTQLDRIEADVTLIKVAVATLTSDHDGLEKRIASVERDLRGGGGGGGAGGLEREVHEFHSRDDQREVERAAAVRMLAIAPPARQLLMAVLPALISGAVLAFAGWLLYMWSIHPMLQACVTQAGK